MIVSHWKSCSTFIQGTSHLESNIVCQDRSRIFSNNGIHVIALSDGAGSRAFSHIGAELTVNYLCDYLVNNFDNLYTLMETRGLDKHIATTHYDVLKKQFIKGVIDQYLIYIASHPDIALNDLACTLLFIAHKGDRYILGHLGDGVIGGLVNNRGLYKMVTLSYPENGVSANITFFTTNSDAIEHFRLSSGKTDDYSGFILMSDGPQDAYYDRRFGITENAVKLFTNFHHIEQDLYKKSLEKHLGSNIAKISDDDLSIALMYLEEIDISDASLSGYKELVIDRIEYQEQVKALSSYGYHVDSTIAGIKRLPSNFWNK